MLLLAGSVIFPIECSVLSSTPDAFPVVDSYAESEKLLLSTDLQTCKHRQIMVIGLSGVHFGL